MRARSTVGDVRPVSSTPVRFRGFCAVLTVAVTISGILILCGIKPAEAGVFHGRQIHTRSSDPTEGLPSTQVFSSATTFALVDATDKTQSNPQPKRVKCYYFKSPPVRTYCRVLGLTGVITAEYAERECDSISMNMLSSKTTPLDRLCTLMRIFSLEEHNIWLADVLNETQQLTFDQCNLEILQENVTKLSPNCTICNIAVICDAGFYHSNGSNCVTVEEGSDEVEYCYFKERASARDSVLRCGARSSHTMDTSLLNGTEALEYIRRLVRTDLEFWVDLRKEDVAELSGVIAFNTEDNDWNTSCITVWFGRDIPWFFKRNCDETYPVICQDSTNVSTKVQPADYSERHGKYKDCVYHKSNSWMFDYCVPDGRTFGMTAGSQFCGEKNMALLRGSTLRELFYVYANTLPPRQHDTDRFLIWDAGYLRGWYTMSTTCGATSLADKWPERERRPCSNSLGYICRQLKPRTCVLPPGRSRPYVEHGKEGAVSRPEMCLSQQYLTFKESVKVCEELGMTLLPEQHVAVVQKKLFEDNQYSSFWVVPYTGYLHKCAVLKESGVVEMGTDCSRAYRAVCIFDTTIPAVMKSACDPSAGCPSTEATTASHGSDSQSSTKVATRTTATTPVKKNQTDAVVERTSAKPATASNDPCLEPSTKGSTNCHDEDEDVSECGSKNACNAWNKLRSYKSIQEVVEGLEALHTEVGVASDIQRMPSQLTLLLQNVDELVANLNVSEKASKTQKLASSVVDLAGKTMEKAKVWSEILEEERLDTVAGLLNSVEDFVIKMIGYQHASSGESKLGSGNLTVQVKQVTKGIAEGGIELGNEFGSSVKLPANLLRNWTKDVSVIFSENRLVKSLMNSIPSPSSQMLPKKPVLVTPFVTATLVTSGSRNTAIGGNVLLSFPFESMGEKMEPQCSFIKITNDSRSEWSGYGCKVLDEKPDRIVCSCDHLTTFAVLMSPRTSELGENGHHNELEWITKIGCGISIVCLMACIVIFTAYRHLKGIRNTIHRNLCLSLLIAEILLLVGMKRDPGNNDVPCIILTFCLHFFFLSAFGWMALEGCHIIVLLWKVFNQKRTYYERYYFAGYGIPLIIASITLGARHYYYTNTKEQYCWLPPEEGIRYSFIAPVAAVIFLNLGALFLVLWKMSHMHLAVEKSTAEKVQNWVRGTFILLPILGVTWLFGFLMLGTERMHLAGAYLFTIFNSLQGLGIFICHVMMSKKTREAIFKSVVSTGSMVKGSISSRPSGTGTTSSKTTWYPISFSSNSTSISSSCKDGSQADTKLPSQSFDTESDDTARDVRAWARLQWWPGARFRYILRMDHTSVGLALNGDATPLGQPILATYRSTRSVVAGRTPR